MTFINECTYEDKGLKPCELSAMDCASCEYNLINQIKAATLSDEQFKFHFPTSDPKELDKISQEYIDYAIANHDINDLYNYYCWLTHEYESAEGCDVEWDILFAH